MAGGVSGDRGGFCLVGKLPAYLSPSGTRGRYWMAHRMQGGDVMRCGECVLGLLWHAPMLHPTATLQAVVTAVDATYISVRQATSPGYVLQNVTLLVPEDEPENPVSRHGATMGFLAELGGLAIYNVSSFTTRGSMEPLTYVFAPLIVAKAMCWAYWPWPGPFRG